MVVIVKSRLTWLTLVYYRLLTTKKGYEPQDNVAERVRKITEHTCNVEGDWQEVSLNDRRLKYKVSCGIVISPIVFAHLFGFNPHLPPQFSFRLPTDVLVKAIRQWLSSSLASRLSHTGPRQWPPRLDSSCCFPDLKGLTLMLFSVSISSAPSQSIMQLFFCFCIILLFSQLHENVHEYSLLVWK